MVNFLDIVCHNRWGENDTMHDNVRKDSNEKLKIEEWNWNKITQVLYYMSA